MAKRGRPKLPEANKKNEFLRIRFTRDEIASIKMAAEFYDVPVSTLVRSALRIAGVNICESESEDEP